MKSLAQEELNSARMKMQIGINMYVTTDEVPRWFNLTHVVSVEPPAIKTLEECTIEELKIIGGSLMGALKAIDNLIIGQKKEQHPGIKVPIKNNKVKS